MLGGCIFKEQNLEGVAKFRAILRGGCILKTANIDAILLAFETEDAIAAFL